VNFLVDTNVVSEWVKPVPNVGLMHWSESVDEDRVFLSVVSLAELRYGMERMQAGKRRQYLEQWLDNDLTTRFAGRILPIDPPIADLCGRIIRHCESIGRPIEIMDAFLAATAQVHQLTMVTRNVSDFSVLKDVLNPWGAT
jgi:toxin FitB